MQAQNWELHDGEQQAGPVDEDHMLRMIADGLPAATMVRHVGEAEWRTLRTHAPFAHALEAAQAREAQEEAPPRKRTPEPGIPTWAVVLVVAVVALVGAGMVARVALAPTEVITSKELPPGPPPAPPPPPSPLQTIMKQTSVAQALAVAAPLMTDAFNEISEGTMLLAFWAQRNLRWSDVGVTVDETSYAKVQKDVDAERKKRLCVSGTVIQSAATKQTQGTLYVGLLMNEAMNFYHFYAVRSSGDIVEQSSARFCGIVTGKFDYVNSAAGTGHAIELVGMFDLPENRAAK